MFDFLKDKSHYDSEGFDADGYNRLGFDRMGYNRDGYDINGYDRDGNDRNGVNKHTGVDKDGYNSQGFNKDGYDRNGYNREGFDPQGYDRDGFNAEGYNQSGFDREGFDRSGIDREGYNREGYNSDGYNRAGFDKNGYDSKGFDINGFDVNGFDRNGFNAAGYDKEGYDKDGFDESGFNKQGYDIDGYDFDGFNDEGYDRDGFDKLGFNSEGLDRGGYDKTGFNKDGISKFGYKREEFDENGYHKNTGLDAWGFNKYGFNVNGINKDTQRDRLGLDSDGFDVGGFNVWGINPDTEEDRFGNPISIYENNENFSDKTCIAFKTLYYEYMAGKHELASALSDAYFCGMGTVKDYRKALRVLIDAACEYEDLSSFRDLSDIFYIGEFVRQNVTMSMYLDSLANGEKIKSINQYKAGRALKFVQPVSISDNTLEEEKQHLKSVLFSVRSSIRKCESSLTPLDSDTSWMDRDQREYWVEQRARNSEIYKQIEDLERIEKKPYYGRMDTIDSSGTEKNYIGENSYFDYNNMQNSVISVWSDIGSRFRDKRANSFTVDGRRITVALRRKFIIEDGELQDYYDEYDGNSEAAEAEITDPYLQRILETKRGEENITNIIRSIQANQNDIIEENFRSNIIVQGCAGSGKTMILLHRLANLKFNNRDFDWSNVVIITPNRDFTLFIDELSKDLGINEIRRITLPEYYIDVISRYHKDFPEVVDKDTNASESDVEFSSDSADSSLKESEKKLVRYRGYSESKEQQKIKKDTEWDENIVEFVYSNEFKNEINAEIDGLKNEITGRRSFGQAWTKFDDIFQKILKRKYEKVDKRIPNYCCVLYAKVLFLYGYLGCVRNTEKMLCIDEGQDFCENHYVLLYDINGRNTCLNVYGDLAQRVSGTSIKNWEKLKKLIDAEYYELNENYRNSEEIIEFYNTELDIDNKSFGISTKNVERFEVIDLDILVKLQLLLKNRTVIITKDKSLVPDSVLCMCAKDGIAKDYVSVMDVIEVKGLEFDTAFVFDEGMSLNERYISYTRALSELYVQSEDGVDSVALGIADEDVYEEEYEKADIPHRETINSKNMDINKPDLVDDRIFNILNNSVLNEDLDDDVDDQLDAQLCSSIAVLNTVNNDKCLIVKRKSWFGDFCFVVESIENDRARGTQYKNGREYRETAFNIYSEEFEIYKGPSRRIIEQQYND